LTFLFTLVVTFASLLVVAGFLHLFPKLGRVGRRVSESLCRAPGLDVVVFYFIAAPLVVGPVVGGWLGLLGAIGGQVAAVLVWTFLHELANRAAVRGPRIVKTLNGLLGGRWRNHAGLWVTAIVAPGFCLVRLGEIISYIPLTWIIGLPAHRHRDWVNVSRQKFEGLVGHDLLWCLYCDWMTGVWSLGTEMLRNVESFWCPIRFASGKKCENCAIDFPDVQNGWVEAGGNMTMVADTLNRMYSGGQRSWFGRRGVQLTVNGKPPASDVAVEAPVQTVPAAEPPPPPPGPTPAA